MGFSVCAHMPVCVCVFLHISLVRTLFLPQCHCSPPTPTSVRLSQSISFRPSLRILSILLLLSPRGRGPIPLALHVCVQNKEHHQISNHQYQCSHMRYLWTVTTQLTHMDACVFCVYASQVLCKTITAEEGGGNMRGGIIDRRTNKYRSLQEYIAN